MLTLIFLLTSFYSLVIAEYQEANSESQQDFPVIEDLDKFLRPIEFVKSHLARNTTAIDLNFALGIFFTNVHLGRVILDKGNKIPNQYLSRIKAVFNTNEKSLKDFHKNLKAGIRYVRRDHVIIAGLFANSSYWIERMRPFRYELQPTYQLHDLEMIYSDWNNYTNDVDNVHRWTPSPKISDRCLVSVAINGKSSLELRHWCPVADTCYSILESGTDFSYALCHRIAFLVMAELGRGCFIFTREEDARVKKRFCTMAYAEAEYISMNNYGIADLMFELICLCATDGRLQFLRREWLHKLFDFQNPNGCFGKEYAVIGDYRRTEKEVCNSHTTGLASGSYAAAVRYILENNY